MSESFDAYHKWLGIPPQDQPPHHYRLLGINPFEDDASVIENAADARMRHVRTFASGPRGNVSQQILTKISKAQSCLLDRKKKTAYDKGLRETLEDIVAPPASQPPPALQPLNDASEFAGLEKLEVLSPVPVKPVSKSHTAYALRTRKSNSVMLIAVAGCVACGLLLAAVVVIFLVFSQTDPNDDRQVVSNPRRDANRPSARRNSPGQRSAEIRSAGESYDLLKDFDLSRDVVAGSFTRQADGSLQTNGRFCRIAIQRSPPAYYEIIAEVKRLSGKDSMVLGLYYKGRRFTAVIDGFPQQGYRSGLNLVNGHTLIQPRNTSAVNGRQLTAGTTSVIRCVMLRDRVEVYVDERQIVSYRGSPGRLSLRSQMDLSGQPDLFLTTWDTSYQIKLLEMRPMNVTGARPLRSRR